MAEINPLGVRQSDLEETMREYGLGPNGAQIVAADLMIANISKMTDIIDTYGSEYVLVDTPGHTPAFFRMQLPTLNVLSKCDTLSDDDEQRMLDWFQVSDALYGDLLDSDNQPETVIGMELFKAVENAGVFGEIRAVSAQEGTGLEEIYAASQLNFFGGDDIGDRLQ